MPRASRKSKGSLLCRWARGARGALIRPRPPAVHGAVVPRGVLHDGRRARRRPAGLLGSSKANRNAANNPRAAPGRLALAGPLTSAAVRATHPRARARRARAATAGGARGRFSVDGAAPSTSPTAPSGRAAAPRRSPRGARQRRARRRASAPLLQSSARGQSAASTSRRSRQTRRCPLLRRHFIFEVRRRRDARGLVESVRPAVAERRAAVLEAQLRARARPARTTGASRPCRPWRRRRPRRVVVGGARPRRRAGRAAGQTPRSRAVAAAGVHLDARLAARQLQREAPGLFAVGRADALTAPRVQKAGRRARWTGASSASRRHRRLAKFSRRRRGSRARALGSSSPRSCSRDSAARRRRAACAQVVAREE